MAEVAPYDEWLDPAADAAFRAGLVVPDGLLAFDLPWPVEGASADVIEDVLWDQPVRPVEVIDESMWDAAVLWGRRTFSLGRDLRPG